MGLNIGYLKTLSGIMKLIEIVCVVTSFSIMRDQGVGGFDLDALYFGIGILVACMIMTPLLLICYLMGKIAIQQTILEVSVNAIFFIFLIIHGGWGLNYYTRSNFYLYNQKAGIAMSCFSLGASVAYFIDTILAALNFRRATS